MFDFIYKGIGTVLAWFESFLGNYLFAILFFALIVKLILVPFSIKQQKNSQKQASLAPKEMAIRNKYKGRENDQEAMRQMQMEVQQMYTDNGYNQFAGCLPMLLQFPIIIVIYKAIYRPLSYISKLSADAITKIKEVIGANADFFKIAADKVTDAGVYNGDEMKLVSILNNSEYLNKIAETVPEVLNVHIPNFMMGNLNLGATPGDGFGWLIIIPFLVFASQFGSMKLTRKLTYQPVSMNQQQQGCSNWIMDVTMPLMLTIMAFTMPALLGVYWIFQTLLGFAQQLILKKVMPMPTFTEEDYKNAERALRGKGKGQRQYDTGKKYRSLHNIDADDD